MGGIAGPIQQVGNTTGQIPQTANVDFGFNNTQNVPFRPQQIPGMAPHVVASLDKFQRMNMGQPQLNHPLNRVNTFFQGLPIRSGFGGNQFYAGGNPNFDERTGTYINPRFPGMLQGGFPQQPQAQQLVDPRQSGLASLAGLNGVPGNQNPLYFGPGYK